MCVSDIFQTDKTDRNNQILTTKRDDRKVNLIIVGPITDRAKLVSGTVD